MKVVVLTGSSSLTPAAARTLRDELGILSDDGSDVVTVVGGQGRPTSLAPVGAGAGAVAGADADTAAARPSVAPGGSRVAGLRRHPKVRKVARAARSGGASLRFAVVALGSRQIQQVVAEADVVVALDPESHRAAWLVARRHRRPDVVVGAAAGKRVIAARRTRS